MHLACDWLRSREARECGCESGIKRQVKRNKRRAGKMGQFVETRCLGLSSPIRLAKSAVTPLITPVGGVRCAYKHDSTMT
ncbi:hypothetical protein BaRGS_00020294 [Batillaria attramentaria]|uniref:Uncharacterized protein n=1 Tax=Batillaria attramentaria TaxID=370345 RepID=A0ABD0KN31_9CAEN